MGPLPSPFCLLSELKIRKNCAFLHVHVNNFRLHFFRKPINSADIHTDSNFESIITLIWAYGQHDHSFYVDDVLKYHGRNKGVRGKLLFVHLFVCSLICLFIHSFNFQICKESLLLPLDSNPFLSSWTWYYFWHILSSRNFSPKLCPKNYWHSTIYA